MIANDKSLIRNNLSKYLPYFVYEDGQYFNTDHSFGHIFECSPLYFAGTETTDILSSLLKQDFGKGAILQFILLADTNIRKHCEKIKSMDIRQTPLTKKMTDDHIDFISNQYKYSTKLKNNKLKNFRLFVAIKSYQELEQTTITALEESLSGAGMHPKNMPPNELLSLLRSLLNGDANIDNDNYDNSNPISKQAILADTIIDWTDKSIIKINNEFISVITPKAQPIADDSQTFNELDINEMMGSWAGGIDDLNQITDRFIWSCNILLDKVDKQIKNKSYLVNLQAPAAKLSNNIGKRLKIFSEAVANLGAKHHLAYIPSLILFGNSEKNLAQSCARITRMWERKSYLMQRESIIKHIIFLQALPFGLYPGKKKRNISLIDRHFIAPAKSIAAQLPLQADYMGFGEPVVPLIGRKGQVQGLDIFDKKSNNHNFLCCATSGSGKSVFVNFLVSNHYKAGAKIRINDLGYSYKKLVKSFGGTYLDIADDDINFNPFQVVADAPDDEDAEHDIETIAMVLGEMCFAHTEGSLNETQVNLLKHAVKHTIQAGNHANGIDSVQEYLNNLSNYTHDIPDSFINPAKELGFNLCEFGSAGQYGRFFNGLKKNTHQDDDFLVLEMESLRQKPALLRVVSLQVINMMTQEMYMGDRSIRKINIFDEVASMFSSSQRLGAVVEDGYRRARKYGGSFGTIFQSILDTKLFGRTGDVMRNNAAFQFYLESKDYQQALENKLISYEPFIAKMLTSIKSNRPHYSEIFADTPGGVGMMRLMLDPYGYGVTTTDADETTEIENYQKQNGMSIDKAIEKFASLRQ